MASNCPYWAGGKCAPPGQSPDHDCSWSDRDFQRCAVHKMATVRAAGGSMADALFAMEGDTGAHIVGSQRRMSDSQIAKTLRSGERRKQWWQFWK